MNKAMKILDGAWSVVCILTTGGLMGLFLFWVLLQRPYLTVNVEGMTTSYTAPAGSIVYIENPIYPPDTLTHVELVAELHSPQMSYRLASPPDRKTQWYQGISQSYSTARPGYTVYPLFIPSYVKPGVYEYEATATYKLNPFKSESLVLPRVIITIY